MPYGDTPETSKLRRESFPFTRPAFLSVPSRHGVSPAFSTEKTLFDRELIETPTDVTKAKDVKWPAAFAFFCFALAFLGFALSGENAGMATAL